MDKPSSIRWFALVRLVVGVLSSTVAAHVAEGTGERLQLYSFRTTNPPVINSCLTDATTAEGTVGVQGTNNDEWRDAAVRKIPIKTSGTDSTYLNLFLMNDDDYLYVGVSSNFNNFGNNTTVQLYFDQGATGGDHNDDLDGGGTGVNNGEYRCQITTNSQSPTEYSFNGTSWATQTPNVFTALAYNFGNALLQSEFKIPLNGNPAADDGHSYLNVTGTQELGFYFQVYTTNDGGMTFYWHATNGLTTDATTSPGWADVRLGVQRSYVTFYPTYNANGTPTINGAITEDAWRGCYRRDLVLTNFAGSTINATLYGVEDNSNNDIYVGLRVHDNDNNAGDYCEIYQEQNNASPASNRNYILDGNIENALIADVNAYAAGDDRYWSSASDSWAADAATAGQNARGAWSTDHYDYEFQVVQDAGGNDLNVSDNGVMGFLFRYHDAGDNTDYYWDLSPNADNIQLDENGDVFVAIGWPDLQLGAPYAQVVFPEDGADVEGVVNIRVYAQDENADGVDSAVYYLASAPTTRYDLTRIGSTNEWSGTLDVADLANGPDTIVIEVGDDDGIVVERLVVVNIANGTGAAAPPTVSITSPAAGSTIGGNQTITFAVAAGSGTIAATEISVDGGTFTATTAGTSHTLATTGLTDGSHTVVVRVTNSNGLATSTPVTTYIVRNTPTVTLTAPAGGATVSGAVTLAYTNGPVSPATTASDSLFVDGKSYKAVETDGSDSVNTTVWADGEHTLQVKITDSNGKTGVSAQVTVLVRNAPAVVLTAPVGSANVSGALTLAYTNGPVSPATTASDSLFVDGKSYKAVETDGSDSVNTSVWADGEHTLQVKITDSNGKTGISALVTVLVRNAPNVVLTAPVGSATVSGPLTLAYTNGPIAPATTASDSLFVDGKSYKTLETDGSDSVNTTVWADGEHTLQVKITDSNGRTGLSALVTVLVRNAPTVVLTAPSADEVLAGTETVRFTASAVAPATLVGRAIYVDGKLVDESDTDSTYDLNTLTLSDGTHSIQVKVTDSADRTGESARILVRVLNTPVVAVTAPAETLLLSGIDTIRFAVTYAPGASRDTTEISFDGGNWIATTGDTFHVWTTTDFFDGSHTVQVRATGTNDKTGYSRILHYRISNTPVVAITAPRGGEVVSGVDTVLFTASAVDPAVIVTREVSLDGAAFTDSQVGSDSYIVSTVDLADGSHSVQVRVTDDHGRVGLSNQVIFLTRNAPSVVVRLPEAGDTLSGTITVRFTATPVNPAGIDSTAISVDGGAWRSVDDDSTATIDSRLLADGSHVLKLRTVDDRGKIGESETRLFVVDNAAPVIAAPKVIYRIDAASAREGTDVRVEVLVRDIVAGLALDSAAVLRSDAIGNDPLTVVMTDDGTQGDTVAGDNVYTAVVTVATSATGPVPYTVTAVDRLGNRDTITAAIVLDNTAPTTSYAIYTTADTSLVDDSDTLFRKAVILRGRYNDEGGSLLLRAFVSVVDDNGRHVGNSPVVLSTRDSLFSLVAPLVTGGNTIMLYAQDRAGNTDSTVIRLVNLDEVVPTARYSLDPQPEAVAGLDAPAVYSDKLVMKGAYADAGGSELSRVFVGVRNDSNLNVNTSPIDLSVRDSVFSAIVHLVPGTNVISLSAVDHAGNSVTVTDTIVCLEPKETEVVGRSGGTVEAPDGASVEVPRDALLSSVEITITRVDPVEQPKPLDSSVTLLYVAHDFGPNGTVFRKPVTIALPYTAADLDRDQDGVADLDPLTLSIVFWDGATWRQVGGSLVDTTEMIVTAQVNHFTIYDLARVTATTPAKVKVYWTRNPVFSREGSTFVFELPEPGTVSLSVLDLAGDVVCRIIPDRSPFDAGTHDGRFVWRGDNVSGRFAGAGLYVYVFTYTNDTGKKTIIRKPLGLLR